MTRERLIEYAQLLWEKIRYSSLFYHSLGAILLGLSLARLANSVFLFLLTGVMPPVSAKGSVATPLRVQENYIDPATIIGGSLFAPYNPQAEKAVESNMALEQIKHFRLIGTLEGDPEFARAILEIPGEPTLEYCISKKYCDHYRVGEIYLAGIGREFIYFRYKGKRFRLEAGQSTQELFDKLNAEAAQAAASPGPAGSEVITRVISREEVNKTILGNPSQIYVGASFGPTIQDGKITGYKIHKVNPDHVFYKLGARPGDIIRKVNDYPLSDTDRMFELWKSIKDMPRVKVEVERDGKIYVYDFHIRN
ncbi:MAG: hypothetical protein NZM25_09255 [Leptospiraceae bacterium]|nr:hypothetical protein [Leptospiraceae bacterium]MDW8307326.1 hypothetical protein [Leptospiraceae bacterium]